MLAKSTIVSVLEFKGLSVSMFVGRCGLASWRRLFAPQECFRSELRFEVGARQRIETLHFLELGGGDLGQVPDETNQLPTVPFALFRTGAEPRHAGEPDPMLDEIEQLAVGEALRGPGREIGRPRVEIATVHGVAPAVVRVAGGAMVSEVGASSAQNLVVERHGIG